MPRPSTFRLYLLGLGLLFAAYVALEYNRPKPLDWTPTYANRDKIPYGTYALFDQLPRLLGTDSVEAVRLPVYSQLTGRSLAEIMEEEAVARDILSRDTAAMMAEIQAEAGADDYADSAASEVAGADSTAVVQDKPQPEGEDEDESQEEEARQEFPLRPEQANYLFVNESFEVSELDARALLHYAARGNAVFIATESFGRFRRFFSDTLGLRLDEVDLVPNRRGARGLRPADSVDLRFTNPALAKARYRLPGVGNTYRIAVDSGRVGRTLATDAQGRAVYVRLDHGQGHFYICSVPRAFTNYHFLQPRTSGFAAAALAYLPARRSWWDEFQKQGPVGEQSLLRVLLGHDALRTAYYLTLLGTLLFVLVYARRRQRIIPTIKPLPNTTLLFTRTVAGLYRQGRNHAQIADKKVRLFQDYLRTRFQEPSPDFNDEGFRERLSQKSGLPRPRVDELLRQVNYARSAPTMNDQQLLSLSKALGDFRREAR